MLKVLILLLLSSWSFALQSAALCYQPLFPVQTINSAGNVADITAKTSTILDTANYQLEGEVEIISPEYILRADKVLLNTQTKNYQASGSVQLQHRDLLLLSDTIDVNNTENRIMNAQGVQYQLLKNKVGGNAQQVVLDEKYQLSHATYSSCNPDNPFWQLRADKMTIDEEQNVGKAYGVQFALLDVPLFWWPEYEWVLSGRQSGLLIPQFSSYNVGDDSGYDMSDAYYINIAPEQDATLTLRNLTTRGVVLGAQYRRLLATQQENGYLELNADYLGNDSQIAEKRWWMQHHLHYKNNAWSVGVDLSRVSDSRYFSDIEHMSIPTASLNSHIQLAYQNNGLHLRAYSEDVQFLQNNAGYVKELELSATQQFSYGGIASSLGVEHSVFNHDIAGVVTGKRTYASANMQKLITDGFYSITPQIKLHSTHYDLANDKQYERTMAEVHLDSKLEFVRDIQLGDATIYQTLTPRVAYFYSPYKEQSHLPLFDSTQRQLTYDNLFANNAWTGRDRIEAADTLAAGVESTLSDTNHNYYTHLALGRNIYLPTGEQSNIFAAAEMQLADTTLSHSLEYDGDAVVAQDSFARYNKDDTFISIGHHKYQNEEYLSASAGFNITGRSHIFTGVKRALSENITNTQVVGLLYNSCCFAVRTVFFKTYNEQYQDYDEQIKLELIFKELGSSDSELYEQIKQHIPEYINNVN